MYEKNRVGSSYSGDMLSPIWVEYEFKMASSYALHLFLKKKKKNCVNTKIAKENQPVFFKMENLSLKKKIYPSKHYVDMLKDTFLPFPRK